MSEWFNEELDENLFNVGARTSIKVEKTLFKGESPYQKLEIIKTSNFGNMMVLDNCVMLTESHEFIYHEMIAHIPLFLHPNPKQVLIIGGGDGGTAREVLKHPNIERCVLVEIDELVVEKSKEFFPKLRVVFDNPKLELRIEDGIKYIENHQNIFDVILIDSTDPVGPAEGLFTENFYRKVSLALKYNGIVVSQAESPYYFQKTQKDLINTLRKVYPFVSLYLANIPFYPSGTWSFSFASKEVIKKMTPRSQELQKMISKLQYLNEAVFHSCFSLPNFIKHNLGF